MKKIIIVLITLGVLFAIYWFFIRMTKPKAIKLIVESGMHSNANATLDSFDDKFLIAWAKAIKKASLTFIVNGKVYNTKGGKSA